MRRLPLLLACLWCLPLHADDIVLTTGWRVVADAPPLGNVDLPHLTDPGDTLGWVLPDDFAEGPYRVAVDVRTGDRPEGTSFIGRYELLAPDRAFPAGAEPGPVRFELGDRAPQMVTQGDGWQVWRGVVPATEVLWLRPGDALAVRASGHHNSLWALHLRPVDPAAESMLAIDFAPPYHLFHVDDAVVLQAQVDNWRDVPATGDVAVRVVDTAGRQVGAATQAVTVPPRTRQRVAVPLELDPPRGALFAEVSHRLGDAAPATARLGFGVTDSPRADAMPDDTIFGVHKGDTSEWPAIGLKWDRLWDTGHTWMTVEKEPGVFDWSHVDAAVEGAERHGVRLVYVFAYTPRFHSARPDEGGGGRNAEPADIAVWRRFVRETVTRYRGRIQHFEVWNEPNAGFFSGTPAAYFELLKAAYEETKAANPEAVVLGISGTGDYLAWMEQVFALGGLDFMDVVAVHTYTTPHLPDDANLPGRLESTRRLIAKYGGEQPIWNTETGLWAPDRNRDGTLPSEDDITAAAPAETRPNWKAGWPYRPLSEERAAAYVVRHYLLQWSQGVERLFWYAWYTHHYPMITPLGEPRLHTVALGALIGQLHDARYVRRQPFGVEAAQVHVFEKGGAPVLAAWTSRPEPLRVSFPSTTARVVDGWGNPVAPLVDNGRTVVELGALPVYVHGLDAGAVGGVRLADAAVVLPPDDAEVFADVGTANVANRTSRDWHGERRVFSLLDPGDALVWRLDGIAPGRYEVVLDARTGHSPPGTNMARGYVLRHLPAEGTPRDHALDLSPGAEVEQTRAGEDGRGSIYYGPVAPPEPLVLRGGDRLVVESTAGGAHIGALTLRFLEDAPAHPPVEVSAPPAPLSVDADLADWPADAPVLRIDQRRQAVVGVADPFASLDAGDQWSGPEDASAIARVLADDEALWVAVEVTDDVHRPAERAPFDGDAIELFLDLRGGEALGSATVGPGVVQVFLVPPAEGTAAAGVARGPAADAVQAAARRTATGYVVEARLPWTLAPAGAPAELGFDIALDDSDTAADAPVHRQAQLVWRGGADNYQNPSAYGRLRRAGEAR